MRGGGEFQEGPVLTKEESFFLRERVVFASEWVRG